MTFIQSPLHKKTHLCRLSVVTLELTLSVISRAQKSYHQVDVHLRRQELSDPSSQSNFVAQDSSAAVFARPPVTPRGPLTLPTKKAKKSSGPPPATLRELQEGFSGKQLSLLNGLASSIQDFAGPYKSDHVYSEREFEAGYTTRIEDVGLSTSTVFQMFDMDSDGFISRADLVHARFFFNEDGEAKFNDLMNFYLYEHSSSEFSATMKKMFLCATRSFFKLRSVIYDTVAAPPTDAGPSPALVLPCRPHCVLLRPTSCGLIFCIQMGQNMSLVISSDELVMTVCTPNSTSCR
jgi:hypothetical protein